MDVAAALAAFGSSGVARSVDQVYQLKIGANAAPPERVGAEHVEAAVAHVRRRHGLPVVTPNSRNS
jgi:hypothetical protein